MAAERLRASSRLLEICVAWAKRLGIVVILLVEM